MVDDAWTFLGKQFLPENIGLEILNFLTLSNSLLALIEDTLPLFIHWLADLEGMGIIHIPILLGLIRLNGNIYKKK